MQLFLAEADSFGPFATILLAILQGIAEFLPISSSGHLVVAAHLFGTNFDITELSIVLHAGTLLSILVFYRREIVALVSTHMRLIPLLILGTIPAAVVGLVIKKKFPALTNDALLAGFMFVVTGFLLLALAKLTEMENEATDDSGKNQDESNNKSAAAKKIDYSEITWKQALIIGLFQAVAILPGISRSGSTIVAGCLVGLNRQSAATFSFLLAIPAILGATLLEVLDIVEKGSSTSVWLLVIGFALAFVVGLASLLLLVRWLEKGKLHLFAYYVIPLGFAVVIWRLLVETKIISSL